MPDLDIDTLTNEIYNAVKNDDDTMTEHFKEGDLREIREILEPIYNLIKEAKEKRMYLYIKPCNKWFSPTEIENKLRSGYYVFTANNWEVRNPADRVKEIENEIIAKIKEIRDLKIYME